MSSNRYTHGYDGSVLRSHRTRTAANSAAYLLPHLRPGMTLLDIGSGAGTITVDLAELVAPGVVTAVEVSEEALALTRAEAERRGCTTIEFVVSDAHRLDLPSDHYDVVHAHQVLQHLADPVAALREMLRVCRPGGLVAARDADYAAFTWFPANAGLNRWLELYAAVARHNGGEPDAGRRLLAWAHAAGGGDIAAGSSTWCFADEESRAHWAGTWAQRITTSSLAQQAEQLGLATKAELAEVADAWHTWAEHPDAWMSVLHGEILVTST